MKFLDTSFLIDYLKGKKYALRFLEENSRDSFCTGTVILFGLFRGEVDTGGSLER
ncbi:MAG: hypothetical protein ABEJ03_05740 [Candidatus Nanohaloarchaea archaeon]